MTIYFIHATHGGPIKVGYAGGDVALRRKNLSKTFPYGVEIIATMDGGLSDEAFIHQCFAPLRMPGTGVLNEWFRSHPALWAFILDAIKSGRPDYLPSGGRFCREEATELACSLFGSTASALKVLGYAPATAVDQVFSERGNARLAARLRMHDAIRKGLLPDYIAALHADEVNAAHKIKLEA